MTTLAAARAAARHERRPLRRHILLALLVIALVAVEIVQGTLHIQTQRERARVRILHESQSRHAELAHDMRALLDGTREHATYLARSEGVVTAASGGTDRGALRARLLPYLVAFRGIDAVSVFDADGRERFRCERIGMGVGVIPDSALRSSPPPDAWAAAQSLQPGAVVVVGVVNDAQRVEVPERDRKVLHYVTRVESAGRPPGTLVLTVYASPFLNAVRRYQPVSGAAAFLIDDRGRAGDADPSEARRVEAAGVAGDAELMRALAAGSESVAGDRGFYYAAAVCENPTWRLVAYLPRGAVADAARHLGGISAAAVAVMAAVTIVLIGAGILFWRLSLRELRLRDEARFMERIRAESDKYRALLEGAADMIVLIEPGTLAIREANAMARARLGVGERDSRSLLSLVAPADVERLRSALDSVPAVASGAAVAEVRLIGDERQEIWADVRCATIAAAGESVLQVSLRDLSRQREMERQLRIAERLGSLGQLTAGVAHEINNPLEGIGNYLALLERETGDAQKRARYLGAIRHGFERITKIVRDLGSFARPGVEPGIADLGQVVTKATQLVHYGQDTKGVAINGPNLASPLLLAGDAGRLEQVFINLFLNAAQAMGGSGTITITVSPPVAPSPAMPFVEIAVEDSGPGIDEAILGRIFDPFFTTRQGSGLGLAISYGIIQDHGGTLTAANRAGGGARFVIRLPRERRGTSGAARR
jgi:signal transduction histidine kinase